MNKWIYKWLYDKMRSVSVRNFHSLARESVCFAIFHLRTPSVIRTFCTNLQHINQVIVQSHDLWEFLFIVPIISWTFLDVRMLSLPRLNFSSIVKNIIGFSAHNCNIIHFHSTVHSRWRDEGLIPCNEYPSNELCALDIWNYNKASVECDFLCDF